MRVKDWCRLAIILAFIFGVGFIIWEVFIGPSVKCEACTKWWHHVAVFLGKLVVFVILFFSFKGAWWILKTLVLKPIKWVIDTATEKDEDEKRYSDVSELVRTLTKAMMIGMDLGEDYNDMVDALKDLREDVDSVEAERHQNTSDMIKQHNIFEGVDDIFNCKSNSKGIHLTDFHGKCFKCGEQVFIRKEKEDE